ncbi:MAG: hypothetical protein ACK5OX_03150 [Desertimonas sp.]
MGYGTRSGFYVDHDRLRRAGVYFEEAADLMLAVRPLGYGGAAAAGGGVAAGAMHAFGGQLERALEELAAEFRADAEQLARNAGRYADVEQGLANQFQCDVPPSLPPMELREINR